MRDIYSSSDQLAIIPQDDTLTLDINAYYSTKSSIKEEKLRDDQFRSNRLNILAVRIF